jgi:hypothetical protein
VILRTHEQALALEHYDKLTQIDIRSWGSMTVRFYRKNDGEKSSSDDKDSSDAAPNAEQAD